MHSEKSPEIAQSSCKAKTSGRLRQEDLEFKVSLHHVLNSRLCELYGSGAHIRRPAAMGMEWRQDSSHTQLWWDGRGVSRFVLRS